MHNSKSKISERLSLLLSGIISVFTVFFMALPALKSKSEFLIHITLESVLWVKLVHLHHCTKGAATYTLKNCMGFFCRSRVSSPLSWQYWLYEEVSKSLPSAWVSASSICLEHAGLVHHVPLLVQFIPIKRADWNQSAAFHRETPLPLLFAGEFAVRLL